MAINIPFGSNFLDIIANKISETYSLSALQQLMIILPGNRAKTKLQELLHKHYKAKHIILPEIITTADLISLDFLFKHDPLTPVNFINTHKQRQIILETLQNHEADSASFPEKYNISIDIVKVINELNRYEVSLDKAFNLAENFSAATQHSFTLLQKINKLYCEFKVKNHITDSEDLRKVNLDNIIKKVSLQERMGIGIIPFSELNQTSNFRAKAKECTGKYMYLPATREITKDHLKMGSGIIIAGFNSFVPKLVELHQAIENSPNGQVYFYGFSKKQKIFEPFENWQIDEFSSTGSIKKIICCNNQIDEASRIASEIQASPDKHPIYVIANQDMADRIKIELEKCSFTDGSFKNELLYEDEGACIEVHDRNRILKKHEGSFKNEIWYYDSSHGNKVLHGIAGIIFSCAMHFLTDKSFAKLMHFLKSCFSFMTEDYHNAINKLEYSIRKHHYINDLSEIKKIAITPDWWEEFENLLSQHGFKDGYFNDYLAEHQVFLLRISQFFNMKLFYLKEMQYLQQIISGYSKEEALNYHMKPQDYNYFINLLLIDERYRPIPKENLAAILLTPIEARLLSLENVIITGLNEGVMPDSDYIDPYLSKFIRKGLAMDSYQTRLELAKHDFQHLIAQKHSIVTYSKAGGNKELEKSRFLEEYQLVNDNIQEEIYNIEKHMALKVEFFVPQARPNIENLPNKISATKLELLNRNPYHYYVESILGLRPINDYEQALGSKEYGIFIHKLLENIVISSSNDYEETAIQTLKELKMWDKKSQLLWHHRYRKVLDNFKEKQLPKIKEAISIKVEEFISRKVEILGRKLEIFAKVDRIDETRGGSHLKMGTGVRITDYKTGRLPSKSAIAQNKSMQLQIIAGILGNEDVELEYVDCSGRNEYEENPFEQLDSNKLIDTTWEHVLSMLSKYLAEATAFIYNADDDFQDEDIAHFARIE